LWFRYGQKGEKKGNAASLCIFSIKQSDEGQRSMMWGKTFAEKLAGGNVAEKGESKTPCPFS